MPCFPLDRSSCMPGPAARPRRPLAGWRQHVQRPACVVLALALAACGYTRPEGDKHPDMPDFEAFAADPGHGLARIGNERESVGRYYWRPGMAHAYAVVMARPDPRSHASDDPVWIRALDARFSIVGDIAVPAEWAHDGLYFDGTAAQGGGFQDIDGDIYVGTARFSPRDERVRRLPCVRFAEPVPPAGDGTEQDACVRSADLAAIEDRIARADSIGRTTDDVFLLRTGGRRELLRIDGHALDPEGNKRLLRHLAAASAPVPEMPDGAVVEDDAVIGNRGSGSRVAFWLYPVRMRYYRIDTRGGPLRFKLADTRIGSAVAAHAGPGQHTVLHYRPGDLAAGRLYVK